ncbi:MAG TPA: UvrD-helicase domain-containing protein, partial [Anaerolineales bacterium]|nr:UvrD-helicase domain-containing protein [Anaerolineales bacterium]
MDIFANLNPQQTAAVTAPAGPTLVMAGPGSGKTRVLTLRVAYLITQLHVAPWHIMAVTFTNKAAAEMRERLEQQLGELRGITVGTFHSICVRILRREADYLPVTRDFAIYDSADQLTLVKQALQNLNIDDKRVPPQKVHGTISNAKNELITPTLFVSDTYYNEVAGRVYAEYQRLLAQNNALDFDDLLMLTANLFQQQPEVLAKYHSYYQHLLVDEFQDTNMAQYSIVRQLAAAHQNLYVVGDADQSIYSWRGADYRNVRRFEKDYPSCRTILLEQNYRSTQVILDAAMGIIDRNPGRTQKKLFTERKGGEKVYLREAYDPTEEAQWVVNTIAEMTLLKQHQPGEVAVMYRTNAQSRILEEAFVRANLPYKLVGATRFYGRKEIKDALAYLRVAHNPNDSVSLLRIINLPPRGIGEKSIENLQKLAVQNNLSMGAILLNLGKQGVNSVYFEALGKRSAILLGEFGKLLGNWQEHAYTLPVAQLLDQLLASSGYADYLNDGTDEGNERAENINELRNVAVEFSEANLTTFLEEVALVSETDNLEKNSNVPTLLTLHAAKGLEYPVVFLVGLMEGVLPHSRSLEDPEAMQEERRLMYVGVTRAKDRLFLSYSFRKVGFYDDGAAEPSRFLQDLPEHTVVGHKTRNFRPKEERSAYQRMTTWENPAPPTRSTRAG